MLHSLPHHSPDGQAGYAALLALRLLHSALPFIKPEKKKKKEEEREEEDKNVQTSDMSGQKSSAILSHLCALLDAEDGEGSGEQSAIQRLAQEIVVKGVVVFFPDATARKEYLLAMIGSVLNEKQPRSWWLKFEALCQYFSKTDANSLLSLPAKMKKVVSVSVPVSSLVVYVAGTGTCSFALHVRTPISCAFLFFLCQPYIPLTSVRLLRM